MCDCDQIWENPPYGILRENRNRNIYQQHFIRTNLVPTLRPITCSVSEICSLLCDDVQTAEIEKLWSKRAAMHGMHSLYTISGRKSTVGVTCRCNERSARMATKTARLSPSLASFSGPLEKKFLQSVYLTNS